MPPSSFTHKVLASKSGDIYQIKAVNEAGRFFFVFLLVSNLQKPAIEKLISQKPKNNVDFTDYGKVITSCYGRYPSEEARKILLEQFDIKV